IKTINLPIRRSEIPNHSTIYTTKAPAMGRLLVTNTDIFIFA
ncbi:unnamed protein product, partial [Heterotrigona itama]